MSKLCALILGAWLVLGRTPRAAAHANGIVTDSCQGCHSPNGAGAPMLTLVAEPSAFNPGDLVTFTLALRAAGVKAGGVFITTGGLGSLRALAGEGLRLDGQGLTHSAPKSADGGVVTFRFAWQAPAQPGGVTVGVAALAANGNNTPTGDAPGSAEFQFAFGCPANVFFLDLDRDGYGSKDRGTRLACAGTAPTGYAAVDGDCDENDEKVHPGAVEICNGKDDNCDTRVDEGAAPVMVWPDRDGDGYYKTETGTPKLGCGDAPGYAARAGDCDDVDPGIHPGAAETCNLRDDNCDGNIDERVRPRCGVGWCLRESLSCDPADCVPGPPRAETCNDFDDDCDGQIDNGACASGATCSDGACVTSGGTTGSGGQSVAGNASGGVPAMVPEASGMPGTVGAARDGGCGISASLRGPGHVGSANRGLHLVLLLTSCAAVRRMRRKRLHLRR